MKGERLDALVLRMGLFSSREAARSAIMDGAVLINGVKSTKPGMPVSPEAKLSIKAGYGERKYVSRGGLKLEKALRDFKIDVNHRICLDVGASTGGFTDCLLRHGASKVYAVDVGYGLIDWRLRNDSRVRIVEKTNARYLEPELLYENEEARPTLLVVDVSFISIAKILPACCLVMDPKCNEIVCLIKPQFEVGKDRVGKHGVVRDPRDHIKAIESIIDSAGALRLALIDLTFSPIVGPKGNIEFLAHFKKGVTDIDLAVEDVVRQAHSELRPQ